MIKIDFQYDTKYGKYSDALYLRDDHAYTSDEIEAMKQERLNNWIYVVENPPELPIVDPVGVDNG